MATRYQFQCKNCNLGPCNYTCPDIDMVMEDGEIEIPINCPWEQEKADWKLKRRPTE